MHAHTIDAANWWARPRGATSAQWVANYQRSLQSRHRDRIVELIQGWPDVTSVLEVGSHCGPNLVRLAQACPALERLTGIDVSAEAIDAGQRWVRSLGLDGRIELVTGRVPDRTDALPDRCADVVLSCYALAYIAPSDLDAVLYEMGRLAAKAIILAEPMAEESQARHDVSGYSEWAHNYQTAVKWIGTWRDCARRIVRVDPPVDRLHGILVAERGAS